MFPAMTRKPVEYPSILYPAARRGGMDGPHGSACLLQESSAACPRPGTPAAAWGARRRHTGVSVQMRHVDPGTVDVFEEMLPAAVDRRVPTCQCQSGEASIMCRTASASRFDSGSPTDPASARPGVTDSRRRIASFAGAGWAGRAPDVKPTGVATGCGVADVETGGWSAPGCSWPLAAAVFRGLRCGPGKLPRHLVDCLPDCPSVIPAAPWRVAMAA